jgi:hypothetical protein
MQKGCNQVVAEQRIQQLYGSNIAMPDNDIAKSHDADVVSFMRRVDREMAQRPSLQRHEAMRLVRKRFPAAYSRFQNVR